MEGSLVKKVIDDWVKEVVIKQNLCPFAADVWVEGFHEVLVFEGNDFNSRMKETLSYLEKSRQNFDSFGTALLVFPRVYENFIKFYNFNGLLDEELKNAGLQEFFQVVTFHPEFRFEGEKKSARGNFVNRSPFPLLHVLRSEDVSKLIEKRGEDLGYQIAKRNKDFLENLTDEEFHEKIGKFITPYWKKK